MFLRKFALAAIFAAAGLAPGLAPAATVMTGDVVTIRYLNPTATTEITGYGFPVNVTVTPGSSDVVSDAFPGGPFFTVNMEPSSIIVTFLQNTIFGPPAPYDGIGIFGIKPHIASFLETSAFGNIVSVSGNSVYFNFAGSNVYAAGSQVVATLALVPLPGAAALFASALAGLGVVGRRRRRAA